MRKVFVVAVREYQAAVRTKAFIIGMALMPVFLGGSIVFQMAVKDKIDTADKRIAVVDRTNRLFEPFLEAAGKYNVEGVFDPRDPSKQIKPRYLLESVQPGDRSVDELTLSLSDRVRDGDLFAFVLIGAGAVGDAGNDGDASIAYHSNSPTRNDLRRWAQTSINQTIQRMKLDAAGIDHEIVREATKRVEFENLGLVSRGESGVVEKAEQTNRLAAMFVPMGIMMMMFMVIVMGIPPLMQSVLEEKTQRVAEVLLSSIPPFQLMWGKLLGMVAVTLTVVTIYFAGAAYAIHRAGFGSFFPGHVIGWFVVYQVLAVLMFGSLAIAVGAAVSDLKESQSLMTPLMLMVCLPLFVWVPIVKDPSSTFAVTMSLIPTLTPMLMTMRMAVPPGVEIWQPILGVVLVMLTTALCVFVAGRVFRVGILMQGKGANLAELMRWVLRG